MFDFIDKTFDKVSFFVNMFIVITRFFAFGSRRNDSFSFILFDDEFYKIISVIALVSEQPFEIKTDCQGLSLCDIMLLTRGKNKAQRIAEAVDSYMNFRAETSSAAP